MRDSQVTPNLTAASRSATSYIRRVGRPNRYVLDRWDTRATRSKMVRSFADGSLKVGIRFRRKILKCIKSAFVVDTAVGGRLKTYTNNHRPRFWSCGAPTRRSQLQVGIDCSAFGCGARCKPFDFPYVFWRAFSSNRGVFPYHDTIRSFDSVDRQSA